MGHSQVDTERRKALKKLAVGLGALAGCAVLPERWVAPIIGNVVLPAHAQTSGRTLAACTIDWIAGDQTSDNISFAVYGSVTPPGAGVPINVAFETTGWVVTGSFDIVTDAAGEYSLGIGPNHAGGGFLTVGATVTSSGASGTASCSMAVPEPN
ncbi:MAG: hypothetical protein OEL83_18845 [Desulforhopalus sp.]|nr:hypothetical protein [Desulforhopalus sp.]